MVRDCLASKELALCLRGVVYMQDHSLKTQTSKQLVDV